MRPVLMLLTTSVLIYAESEPPKIPAEIQRAYEQARGNEVQSAALHDADLARLKIAGEAMVAACGTNTEPRQSARDQPFTCIQKKVEEPKAK